MAGGSPPPTTVSRGGVTGFAFRQASNIGAMLIDNLKVGKEPSDVTEGGSGNDPAILSQPASHAVLVGKTILFFPSGYRLGAAYLSMEQGWLRHRGSNSSALAMANVSADDARGLPGLFQQADGAVESDTATLDVQVSSGADAVTIRHLRSLLDDNREPSDTKNNFYRRRHRHDART
ncbi:MAG: hypothetical protein Ct9H300mP7_2490 [Verrucomicrobiota bacterium]|nr:MAG: hypothetical protein Ct9H300mP7_2490 [Verrucomicrobiota bacterium]